MEKGHDATEWVIAQHDAIQWVMLTWGNTFSNLNRKKNKNKTKNKKRWKLKPPPPSGEGPNYGSPGCSGVGSPFLFVYWKLKFWAKDKKKESEWDSIFYRSLQPNQKKCVRGALSVPRLKDCFGWATCTIYHSILTEMFY